MTNNYIIPCSWDFIEKLILTHLPVW